MTPKPFEIYTNQDWKYLRQPKVEGQWFERKAQPIGRPPKDLRRFKYDNIARPICGFANSNPDVGGLLVIGISDTGEVIGIDQFGEDYLNSILSYGEFLDGPTPEHKIVDVKRNDGSDDHVIFIYTPFQLHRVARTTDGQCHVRRGDKTVTLNPPEAQDFAYQKGELNFEDEPASPFDEADLDAAILKEFTEQLVVRRRLRDTPSAEDSLRISRLLVIKNGTTHLTKGGLLVFHKDPRSVIQGAYVRYFRYEGRDDQSVLIRDEQFEGPLPTTIQQLREFLPTQFARFSYRKDGALVTEDEYPREAWDEAVVNALVHRSYSQQTRPIWIRQFTDRLEVISPGNYPLGVTPDNLIHTPRNIRVMEALRPMNFVRMAEEGTKTMRRVMAEAGLPPPQYSPPELDRVTCTLFNNIDERVKARTDPATRARISPTSIVTNIFPLLVSSPTTIDPTAPFAEFSSRPTFSELRTALFNGLRKASFHIESFAGVSAVNFAQEYVVPALAKSRTCAIYPGIEFRLLELDRKYFLVVDYTVEVRNRADAKRVKTSLPWLKIDNHRKCFVRGAAGWSPGYIVEAKDGHYKIELKLPPSVKVGPVTTNGNQSPTMEVENTSVVPELSTTELTALLKAEGVRVNLVQEIRKASLAAVKEAPRRRLEQIHQIVKTLSTNAFPLIVGPHEITLSQTPTSLNEHPFFMGQQLLDPKAQFDSKGLHQDEDILHGIVSYGTLEKPEVEVPLILMCPADWAQRMQTFIDRVRRGSGNDLYRGVESTFGIRLGAVQTVIAETEEYESQANRLISELPVSMPVFIVFAPERGISRANYDSPYYRLKRLFLEKGFPSQMVKEETLENPEYKDLNFALDVFAKAGYVPWVLSEGMPNADLFIGLSSSLVKHKDQRHRVVGYANVFDEFGKWLFYEGASNSVPFEQRNEMFAGLLNELVGRYQAQRRKLQRVHVHHSAKLRRQDRDQIAKGVWEQAPDAEISFVYINKHNAFRIFDDSPRTSGAAERGTWITLSANQFVMTTTGLNPMGQKFLGTPRPLDVRINRLNARGPMDLAIYAQHILSLTRLNWASTRAFCHDPITIKFAEDIAYLMNVFLASAHQFKLNPRLRNTPWFL